MNRDLLTMVAAGAVLAALFLFGIGLHGCTITLRTEALPNAEQVTWQNAVTRRVNSSIICAPQEQRDCIDTVEKGGH
jgi:hypothetical protein